MRVGGVCISADTVKRAVVLESKLGEQRKMRRLIPQRAGLCIQESMDLPAAARGTKDTIERQAEGFCVWPSPNTDVVVQKHSKSHDQRRFGIGISRKHYVPPGAVLVQRQIGIMEVTL
jgi:hypothetical protein